MKPIEGDATPQSGTERARLLSQQLDQAPVRSYGTHLRVEERGRANYTWFSFLLRVPARKGDFQVAKLGQRGFEPTPADDLILPHLFHEYTHFLQNVAHYWGTHLFADFAYATLAIGASEALASLWGEGWALLRSLKERLSGGGNRQRALPTFGEAEQGSVHYVQDERLWIDWDGVSHEVNVVFIREHMAHLGAMLSLRRGDDAIHLLNYYSFCPDGHTDEDTKEFFPDLDRGRLVDDPKYWLMFERLVDLGFTRVAEGLVLACAASLDTTKPDRAIARFFTYIDRHGGTERDLRTLASQWSAEPAEVRRRQDYGAVVRVELRKHLVFAAKHPEIDYAVASARIARSLLQNLDRRDRDETLSFTDIDEITSPYYLGRRITAFGTPLVKFRDTTDVFRTEFSPKLDEDLLLVLGANLVLNQLLQAVNECPLLKKLPICVEPTKGDYNCESDPRNKVVAGDKQCLYRNGLLLLRLHEPQRLAKAAAECSSGAWFGETFE